MIAPSLKIMICILHYGNPALTRRLHRQLLESDLAWAPHIRVLDNAAPHKYEGAYAEGEKNTPRINAGASGTWERLPENIYWSGALDFALARAEREGYSYLWFFNNDVIFTSAPPYLSRAAERLTRLEGICGPVGVYAPTVERNPYHAQMIRNPAAQWRRTAYVDGIAPLLSLEAVRAVGGLDAGNNIYGYGLDIWLSLRIARAGRPVLVDHQVALRHTYHATAGRLEGFLARAAEAEKIFLTDRLGADYKDQIKALQLDYKDEYKI